MSKAQAPARAGTGAGVEADQAGRKVADALEQMAGLAAGNRDDRQLVRATLLELINYGRQGNRVLSTAEQALQRMIEVDNDDLKKQSDAGIRDLDERRASELAEKAQRLLAEERREDRSQKREDERHEQEMRERETTREDSSRERNLFMNLTALSVVATIVFGACTVFFLFLSAKNLQPWGYAAGASLALTAITSLTGGTPQRFRMLFSLAKSGGNGSAQETKES